MEFQQQATKTKKEKKAKKNASTFKEDENPSEILEFKEVEAESHPIENQTHEETSIKLSDNETNQEEVVDEYENKLYENSSNYAQLFEETNKNNEDNFLNTIRDLNDLFEPLKSIPLNFINKVFKKEAFKEYKRLCKNVSDFQNHVILALSKNVEEETHRAGKKKSPKKKKDPQDALKAPIYKPLDKVEPCLLDYLNSDPMKLSDENEVISRASIMKSLYRSITDDMKVQNKKSILNVVGRLRILFDEIEKIVETRPQKDIEEWNLCNESFS
jgi:hypothetical protein